MTTVTGKRVKKNGFGEPITSFGQPAPEGFDANLLDDEQRKRVDEEMSNPVVPGITRFRGYEDINKYLEEEQKRSNDKAKDADRRARLAKTHQMIGGIADMGRALANLIATVNYAPNAYDPRESLSEKARERYDKAIAEREGYKGAALNYALRRQAADQAEANRQATEKYHNAIIAQRADAAKAKAEADAQKEKEKVRKAASKQYIDAYSPLWESYAMNGNAVQLAEVKRKIDEMEESGEIDPETAKEYRNGVVKAEGTAERTKSKRMYQQLTSTSRSSGSGRGGEKPTFVTPFGEVVWPKEKTTKTYGYHLPQIWEDIASEREVRLAKRKGITPARMELAINMYLYDTSIPESERRAVYEHMLQIGRPNEEKQALISARDATEAQARKTYNGEPTMLQNNNGNTPSMLR